MKVLKFTISIVYYITYGIYRMVMSTSNILPRMMMGATKSAFKFWE